MTTPIARNARAGLTEKQRARYARGFRQYDANKDGHFEWDDIIAVRRKFATAVGLPFESPIVQAQLAASRVWYDTLLAAFDSDKDGKLSLEEVQDAYASISKAPNFEAFSPIFKAQANSLIRFVDKNGDGKINFPEYQSYYRLYFPGATEADVRAQYKLLARGKAAPTTEDVQFVFWDWVTNPGDPERSFTLPSLENLPN